MNNINNLKEALLAKKNEISRRVEKIGQDLRRENGLKPMDSEDYATETENDVVLDSLEREGLEELELIDSALQKIENGDYGSCGECGEEISEARLKALPFATNCIACQIELEAR